MSDFEKYLKENQRKFDLDQINPEIWQSIEKGIKGKKSKMISLRNGLLGLAAAILIGIFCIQWFGYQERISFPEQLLANYGFNDSDVRNVLDTKITAISQASIPVAYKSDIELLLEQVKFLDQHFAEKMNKLTSDNLESELSREVLEYYKTKSEILDRVIDEIQKINNNEEEYKIKSEKTSIQM